MEIKLPFGLREGKITHISEIPFEEKGLNCNCTCPECGKPLVARKGQIKVHHFAHSNINCLSALETALHLFAKEILEKRKTIKLPALTIERMVYDDEDDEESGFYTPADWHEIGYRPEQIEVVRESVIQFDSVVLEQSIDGGLRPDIILYKNNHPLLVEIAVTHYVDKQKQSKIKKQGISAIEIDLQQDKIDFYNFDRANIEDLIINSTECKHWIYNKKEEEVRQRLKEEEELRRQEAEKKYQRRIVTEQKNKEARIARVKQYNTEEYQQKKLKEFNSKIHKDKLWIAISKELGITFNNTPEFLNIKVDGELAIDCDRRIWQSHIFWKFIKARKGDDLKVVKIVSWLKKHSDLPVNKDLVYTKDMECIKVPDLTDAVYSYLKELEGYGIIECYSDHHSYYASFSIVNNDFKTLKNLTKAQIQEKVQEIKKAEVKLRAEEREKALEEAEKARIRFIEERQKAREKELEEMKERFKLLPRDLSYNSNATVAIYNKVGICRYCGKETDDWVSFDGADGTCRCRACRVKS